MMTCNIIRLVVFRIEILSEKKFILNADDFGLSDAINTAILDGYSNGILKSASLVANGVAFDDAITNIIPQCPELGVGIHLNIVEGKSLCSDVSTLTDSELRFNNSFLQLLIKSYNPKEKEFLADLEREFRRQIEKVLSRTKVSHIDSHQHIHAIPKIFEIVCRLASEYGIKNVRTHFEKIYLVPDVFKVFCFKYLLNISRVLAFDAMTLFNEATAHSYNLKTNDYLVGLTYDMMIDSLTVAYGAMSVKYKNSTVEAIIHPCRYKDGTVNHRFTEYLLTKNKKLKEKIEKLGFEITNYVEKSS